MNEIVTPGVATRRVFRDGLKVLVAPEKVRCRIAVAHSDPPALALSPPENDVVSEPDKSGAAGRPLPPPPPEFPSLPFTAVVICRCSIVCACARFLRTNAAVVLWLRSPTEAKTPSTWRQDPRRRQSRLARELTPEVPAPMPSVTAVTVYLTTSAAP